MAQKKTAPADTKALEGTAPKNESPKAPAKPQRVKMRNTKPTNGKVGIISNPLKKDAAKWRAAGWVDAD